LIALSRNGEGKNLEKPSKTGFLAVGGSCERLGKKGYNVSTFPLASMYNHRSSGKEGKGNISVSTWGKDGEGVNESQKQFRTKVGQRKEEHSRGGGGGGALRDKGY